MLNQIFYQPDITQIFHGELFPSLINGDLMEENTWECLEVHLLTPYHSMNTEFCWKGLYVKFSHRQILNLNLINLRADSHNYVDVDCLLVRMINM